MVSPPKLHQQQQLSIKKTPTTTTTTTTTTSPAVPTRGAAANVRIQKGPKPLEKKIFYLDIKNHALSAKLEAKIKELGGAIELFLVKNVSVVVTDRSDKVGQATTSDIHKWGCTSGESGGPPSLRSIEVPTPTPTPPTPYRSVEGPLSNSTNQRGQPTHRSKSRVDAMLERALTQPQQCSVDPLNNALSWGIPIWSIYELQSWLEKISNSLKSFRGLKSDSRTGTRKELKVKHLKEPYIKFESYRRDSRPVFVELKTQEWPTLNFYGDPGSCPFDLKRKENQESACNKEIKENREKYCSTNITKGKDMTRRPRAPAARGRKTENTGYCEICRVDYRSLSKHLQSDQHLSFVDNDKNFLSLDNLISTGASVEAFLKINRTKDVNKDCLFSSRDHSLDNGILSLDEKSEKRNKSNLNDFQIDEVKMMQCNGARRNLNLDSTHNLRTRTKHESGHLLRSKGRPLSEEQKPSEKSFEKYTIKKRAKGTIWIEENDSDEEDVEKEQEGCEEKPLCNRLCEPETKNVTPNGEIQAENVSVNGDVDGDVAEPNCDDNSSSKVVSKDNTFRDSLLEANVHSKVNGYEKRNDKHKLSYDSQCVDNIKEEDIIEDNIGIITCKNVNIVNNDDKLPLQDNEDTNSLKSLGKEDKKSKQSKRGGRTFRGRHRLSVEERLIEDNRDYYKVEVLGNKLRSSAIPSINVAVSSLKEQEQKSPKEDKPSSEKPVVVRFKRVRKSELSLLSDEAESFMFGDPRRGEDSEDDQSSVLPKDTESDREDGINSFALTSSPPEITVPKQEIVEDESQDSTPGRARKRRRTQTEALIMDNTDYYKFETPGSRLRYQAPLTGISNSTPQETKDSLEILEPNETQVEQKMYPSKPSPEVEKMHFSFEAVPKSEPWYQTYQRQDEGAEYWHYFSESDSQKPFLLPYEIENFHEILRKNLQNNVHRKRGRSRGGHLNMGTRSPRKSPRCHASTLAIMSTIIRRREQQQTNLPPVEEESDVDEDLNEIVKNLDEMLTSNDVQEFSFEVDLLKNADDIVIEPEAPPKGAPPNLLELLDNCHDAIPSTAIENSSCASSECGDLTIEFPSKRRKKRKNKTGWPGNKMRRKIHIKNLGEELQKELKLQKKSEEERINENKTVTVAEEATAEVSVPEEETAANEVEHETGKENEQVLNTIECKGNKGRRTKNKESQEYKQESKEVKDTDEVQSKNVLKSVFGEDISSRKKKSEMSEKCQVENDEVELPVSKKIKSSESKGTLSSVSEDSEASLSNNENVYTKDTNSLVPHDKNSSTRKRRQRKNTATSEVSQSTEAENRRTSDATPKKLQKVDSDSQDTPLDIKNKNRKKSKKCKPNNRTPSKVIFDDENCKKESFLSVNERRRLKRVRRNDSVSSELQNGEIDSALTERISPSLLTSSDIDQRRSSIDFQPVVRVMKIDDHRSSIDQVDMDNSILSVTVASNRRLRSSSSPRSNMQPPAKRFRHGTGKRQFSGQWIKNS